MEPWILATCLLHERRESSKFNFHFLFSWKSLFALFQGVDTKMHHIISFGGSEITQVRFSVNQQSSFRPCLVLSNVGAAMHSRS